MGVIVEKEEDDDVDADDLWWFMIIYDNLLSYINLINNADIALVKKTNF